MTPPLRDPGGELCELENGTRFLQSAPTQGVPLQGTNLQVPLLVHVSQGLLRLDIPKGTPRPGVSLTWDFKPEAQVYVSPWHRIGRIQQTLDSPSLRVFSPSISGWVSGHDAKPKSEHDDQGCHSREKSLSAASGKTSSEITG